MAAGGIEAVATDAGAAKAALGKFKQWNDEVVAGMKQAFGDDLAIENVPTRATVGTKSIDEIISAPMEARWEHRINIRKGDGSKSSGMEYAWKRHGGGGTSKKSQFTISRAEVETILQDKNVIQAPAVKSATSGNYICQVDVGKIIGDVASDKGGRPTSVVTIITDEAGNLVNLFPGTLDFQVTLPK